MTATRVLAAVAALAAVCAAVAGTRPSAHYDHARFRITALQLAQWLREHRRVHVFDLRSASAFHEFALPGAMHTTLSELAQLEVSRADTVVLYGARADATRGWSLLQSASFEHVFMLPGGVDEWASSVLNPVLPNHATAAEEAVFAGVAELSRYFGGVPRRADVTGDAVALPPAADEDDDAVQRSRRRGC